MFGFGSKNQDKFLVFSDKLKEGEKHTFDMTFFSLTYIPPEPKTKEKPPNAWFARGTQLTLEEDTIIDTLDIEDHNQKTEDGKPIQAIQTLEKCKFKSVKFYEPSRFKNEEKDPKGLIITFDIMFDDLEKKKTFWEKKNGGKDLLFLSVGRSTKQGGMFSSGGNPIPVFRQLTDGGSDQLYYTVVDLVISEGVKGVGYDSYFIDSLKAHLTGKHQSEQTSKTPDAAPGTGGKEVADSFKRVEKATQHLGDALSGEKEGASEEQKKGGKGKKTYRKKSSKKHKKKRISKKRRINGKK
jgi:hypothetical protein